MSDNDNESELDIDRAENIEPATSSRRRARRAQAMDAEREPEQSREQTSSRAIQIASELLPFTVHVLPRDKRPMFPVQTLPVTLALTWAVWDRLTTAP